MFDIGFKVGDVISHDKICKKMKCGCMGGIRFSKSNNVIVLFMNNNSVYSNSWDGDVLQFMGSGKGNQSLDRGYNQRLAKSNSTNTDIYLFEWVDTINCKYVSKMKLIEKPFEKNIIGKNGEKETKVIFLLKKENL
jgi:5-methylcytosine-specific restriction protein A